jgi:hypothetical protein
LFDRESRLRRALGNDAAAERRHRIGRKPLDDLMIGDDCADAQTRETEPLRKAVDRDRAFRIEARSRT